MKNSFDEEHEGEFLELEDIEVILQKSKYFETLNKLGGNKNDGQVRRIWM